MSEPDWRKILVAYISHVGCMEGVDFLGEQIDDLAPSELACLYEAGAETASDLWATRLREMAQQQREKAQP